VEKTSRNKRLGVILAAATAVAIPAEGLRQKAYRDPPGVLTVCYGSTTAVDPSKVYTIEECRSRLDTDMTKAILTVERCVPGIPDKPLIAFSDAVYNIGPTIACDTKRSTAARYLKAKQWEKACAELLRWNKAKVAGSWIALPGLTKRRQAEYQICMG
jgi:lysozyme